VAAQGVAQRVAVHVLQVCPLPVLTAVSVGRLCCCLLAPIAITVCFWAWSSAVHALCIVWGLLHPWASDATGAGVCVQVLCCVYLCAACRLLVMI
jgi:hypothetical protein